MGLKPKLSAENAFSMGATRVCKESMELLTIVSKSFGYCLLSTFSTAAAIGSEASEVAPEKTITVKNK